MPTLSEAFTSYPVRLNHPHLFDFGSLRELPDSHAWPTNLDNDDDVDVDVDHRHHPSSVADAGDDDHPPVIDLSGEDVVNRVGQACETWGVFQVTGHGVASELLDRLESECRRLFSLPAERKLTALRPPGGISGYGLARISSFFSKLMWSEGFTIVGSPAADARKLWPHDHARFCEVIDEYQKEMEKLAGKLMLVMLASLGLTVEDLSWAAPPAGEKGGGGGVATTTTSAAALQLNSYPACPDPDRAMGLAAHTDSSLLTILYQSSTSGLQVLRRRHHAVAGAGGGRRRWAAVPPVAGAVVVNVGDLFQILSNGRYRSVVHRAVVNRTRHRLSVAYICGPPAQAEVCPAGKLVGSGRARCAYRAVTWPEYLGVKAKLFDKALASVMLSE